METQTIFTQIVQHLARQRKSAAKESGNCQYRTACGDRCAVGYLIPTWWYTEELEGNTAIDDIVKTRLVWAHGSFTNEQWLLLSELQSLHDGELDLLTESQSRLPINLYGNDKVSVRRERLIQRLEYLAKVYEVIIPRAFYDWMNEVNDG